MARGPKKHMKRLNAPKHWMLDKMGGMWAPRPSTGPHKLRECLPVILCLRNRLKYALTHKEAQMICIERNVKIDGRVRTDPVSLDHYSSQTKPELFVWILGRAMDVLRLLRWRKYMRRLW